MSNLRTEFEKGNVVILDNKHEVFVISQTKERLFTKIKADLNDDDATGWEVMTNRLSKLNPEK